ncbi:MAG: chemotaxis protein CheW [Coriobacteriia bacterium]
MPRKKTSAPVEADVAVLGVETSAPVIERVVMFFLEDRKYAFPIDRVQEIQQIVELTTVPDVAPALVGMINLRGSVVPVVDLRLLLGLEELPYNLQTPMIICRSGEYLVAIIVDEVEDVVPVPEGSIEPPSSLYALQDRMLGVWRMGAELVFVLDLDRLVPEEALAATGGDVR